MALLANNPSDISNGLQAEAEPRCLPDGGAFCLANLLLLRPRAGGDFVFVGSEGCQDFVFLTFGYLEEVEGPSEFCCDLINFFGGYPQIENFWVSVPPSEAR